MDRSAPKRTPRSSVNRQLDNERHRRYYASHKEEINRRRRELYAAKKRTSEIPKMECATNGEPDQTTVNEPSGEYPPSGLPIGLVSSSSCAAGPPVEDADVHGDLAPVVVQDVADSTCVGQLDQTLVDQPSHECPGSCVLADKVPAVLPTALVSSSSYAVSKNWINRKSREYYASHKEGIKKRRRELYADRRKMLEGANMESNTSMRDTAQQQESIPTRNIHKYPSSARQIGEPTNGETSNAHTSSYVRENQDFQQTLSTHHATNLYIDDNLIKKVIGNLRKKEQVGGDLGEYICSSMLPTDDRTIVLPKRRPCSHCRAYKFYKETDRFCCGAGEIAIAEYEELYSI